MPKPGATTLYVQFVRGSNGETQPSASARPVGPKLSEKLGAVFKWKRYWELQRSTVALAPGQTVRKKMSLGRDLEIELLTANRLSIKIYLNNKLSRSRIQPAESVFYVTGGEEGQDQSWFIVVRRDKPVEGGHI